MINIPPIKSSPVIKSELIADVSKVWRVGQILNATVQQGGKAESTVLIQLGGSVLEAKTPINLQTGQGIQLMVKSVSENQPGKLPLLTILSPEVAKAELGAMAAKKLGQFIAIQQSFSLLQNVSQNLLAANVQQRGLPKSLKILLQNMQSNLQLSSENINGPQLKQQLLNSGIFLEAKLLNEAGLNNANNTGLSGDFKFQLLAIRLELFNLLSVSQKGAGQAVSASSLSELQLLLQSSTNVAELIKFLSAGLSKSSLSQITELLSKQMVEAPVDEKLQQIEQTLRRIIEQQPQINQRELVEQLRFRLQLLDLSQMVEQSISKLTSLQLQPLGRDADNLVLLLFNLVFKSRDEQFDIKFRIEEENKSELQEKSWRVILDFEFNTLGKVQSVISLKGSQFSGQFYAEKQSTANKVEQLLPLLHMSLAKAGFAVSGISVERRMPNEEVNIKSRISILDEKA